MLLNEELSVKLASRLAGVEPMTIYRWIKSGLPYVKRYWGTRKVIRIKKVDLLEYMTKRRLL